jgi:hypothetical protein
LAVDGGGEALPHPAPSTRLAPVVFACFVVLLRRFVSSFVLSLVSSISRNALAFAAACTV